MYNKQKRKQKYRDRVNKGMPPEVRQIINRIDLQFTIKVFVNLTVSVQILQHVFPIKHLAIQN